MGIAAAILAAVAFGVSATFSQLGLQYIGPMLGTMVSVFGSLAWVLALALIAQPDSLLAISLMALLWFGMIGVINYSIGRYLRYAGATYVGLSRSASISSATPLFTMIFAVVFLREALTWPVLVGTAAVATGLYLLARE